MSAQYLPLQGLLSFVYVNWLLILIKSTYDAMIPRLNRLLLKNTPISPSCPDDIGADDQRSGSARS